MMNRSFAENVAAANSLSFSHNNRTFEDPQPHGNLNNNAVFFPYNQQLVNTDPNSQKLKSLLMAQQNSQTAQVGQSKDPNHQLPRRRVSTQHQSDASPGTHYIESFPNHVDTIDDHQSTNPSHQFNNSFHRQPKGSMHQSQLNQERLAQNQNHNQQQQQYNMDLISDTNATNNSTVYGEFMHRRNQKNRSNNKNSAQEATLNGGLGGYQGISTATEEASPQTNKYRLSTNMGNQSVSTQSHWNQQSKAAQSQERKMRPNVPQYRQNPSTKNIEQLFQDDKDIYHDLPHGQVNNHKHSVGGGYKSPPSENRDLISQHLQSSKPQKDLSENQSHRKQRANHIQQFIQHEQSSAQQKSTRRFTSNKYSSPHDNSQLMRIQQEFSDDNNSYFSTNSRKHLDRVAGGQVTAFNYDGLEPNYQMSYPQNSYQQRNLLKGGNIVGFAQQISSPNSVATPLDTAISRLHQQSSQQMRKFNRISGANNSQHESAIASKQMMRAQREANSMTVNKNRKLVFKNQVPGLDHLNQSSKHYQNSTIINKDLNYSRVGEGASQQQYPHHHHTLSFKDQSILPEQVYPPTQVNINNGRAFKGAGAGVGSDWNQGMMKRNQLNIYNHRAMNGQSFNSSNQQTSNNRMLKQSINLSQGKNQRANAMMNQDLGPLPALKNRQSENQRPMHSNLNSVVAMERNGQIFYPNGIKYEEGLKILNRDTQAHQSKLTHSGKMMQPPINSSIINKAPDTHQHSPLKNDVTLGQKSILKQTQSPEQRQGHIKSLNNQHHEHHSHLANQGESRFGGERNNALNKSIEVNRSSYNLNAQGGGNARSKSQLRKSLMSLKIEAGEYEKLEDESLPLEKRQDIMYRILKSQLDKQRREILQYKRMKKELESAKIAIQDQRARGGIVSDKEMARIKYQQEKLSKMTPQMINIIENLTRDRKHSKYCRCCKHYEKSTDELLNQSYDPSQMSEYMRAIKVMNNRLFGTKSTKNFGSVSKPTNKVSLRDMAFKETRNTHQFSTIQASHTHDLNHDHPNHNHNHRNHEHKHSHHNHQHRQTQQEENSRQNRNNKSDNSVVMGHISKRASQHDQSPHERESMAYKQAKSLASQPPHQETGMFLAMSPQDDDRSIYSNNNRSAYSRDARNRLLGNYNKHRHICSTVHSVKAPVLRHVQSARKSRGNQPIEYVNLELRPISEPPSVRSVCLSALELSYHDMSQQVDKISHYEVNMQTVAAEARSVQMETIYSGKLVDKCIETEKEVQILGVNKRKGEESLLRRVYEVVEMRAEQETEEAEYVNYDWKQSGLYPLIKAQYDDNRKGKDLITSQKSMGLIKNMRNPNEDYEENLQDASASQYTKNELMAREVDLTNLNPDVEDIYSEMEVQYMASLLKKKASTYNTEDILSQIHVKAMKTLEVLNSNLVAGDIPINSIFNFYREPKRDNIIRLLLRCKKMYEARVDVKKILLLLVTLQEQTKDIEVLRELEVKRYKRADMETFQNGMRLLLRVQRELNIFREDHKIFKAKFMFNARDQYTQIPLEFEELSQFIQTVKLIPVTVEEEDKHEQSASKERGEAKRDAKAFYMETFKVLEEEQRSLMTESRAGHTQLLSHYVGAALAMEGEYSDEEEAEREIKRLKYQIRVDNQIEGGSMEGDDAVRQGESVLHTPKVTQHFNERSLVSPMDIRKSRVAAAKNAKSNQGLLTTDNSVDNKNLISIVNQRAGTFYNPRHDRDGSQPYENKLTVQTADAKVKNQRNAHSISFNEQRPVSKDGQTSYQNQSSRTSQVTRIVGKDYGGGRYYDNYGIREEGYLLTTSQDDEDEDQVHFPHNESPDYNEIQKSQTIEVNLTVKPSKSQNVIQAQAPDDKERSSVRNLTQLPLKTRNDDEGSQDETHRIQSSQNHSSIQNSGAKLASLQKSFDQQSPSNEHQIKNIQGGDDDGNDMQEEEEADVVDLSNLQTYQINI